MRLRYRKKVTDKRSLFNIHLAKFTTEINQTIEEAYKSLDEFLGSVDSEADDEDRRSRSVEETTDRPPSNL